MAKAYDVSTSARSFLFKSTRYGYFGAEKEKKRPENLRVIVEGKYAAPDRMKRKYTGYHKDEVNEAGEQIIVAQRVYIKEAGEWEEVEPHNGENARTRVRWLFATVEALVNPQRLADEKVQGVTCLHYRGQLDARKFLTIFYGDLDTWDPEDEMEDLLELEQRSGARIDLWVSKEDYLILKIEVDRQDWENITVTEFWDYNQPIEIEPPSQYKPFPWAK